MISPSKALPREASGELLVAEAAREAGTDGQKGSRLARLWMDGMDEMKLLELAEEKPFEKQDVKTCVLFSLCSWAPSAS